MNTKKNGAYESEKNALKGAAEKRGRPYGAASESRTGSRTLVPLLLTFALLVSALSGFALIQGDGSRDIDEGTFAPDAPAGAPFAPDVTINIQSMSPASGTGYSWSGTTLTITGSGSSTYKLAQTSSAVQLTRTIIISAKVTAAVSGVNISGNIELQNSAELTLLLEGTNRIDGSVIAPAGTVLTIDSASVGGSSAGSVTVTAAEKDHAGIGGRNGNGGTITINGGTVNATGGSDGAGIGGGRNGNGGMITISGDAVVTAAGGDNGAGIGAGDESSGVTNITINGGTVNATGGINSAGIGGGRWGAGTTVTINGGTVKATGGSDGAGIGGGSRGSFDNITINAGKVTASGGYWGAGIGGGASAGGPAGGGFGGMITINGGTVNAKGGYLGGGIGSGRSGNTDGITISGTANVTAEGGDGSAGIGGEGKYSENIAINGNAVVTASGGRWGAGIGGGQNGNGGTITISGTADVTAAGSQGGAGIGGGNGGNGGTVLIEDGPTVDATGSGNAAGIGGGDGGSGGSITISGTADVTATGGSNAAGIGGGRNGAGANMIINGSAAVKAYSDGTLPAVHALGGSGGSGFYVNAMFAAALSSSSAVNIYVFEDGYNNWTVADKTDLVTLPAGYRAFAYTTGPAVRDDNLYADIGETYMRAVDRVSDNLKQVFSVNTLGGYAGLDAGSGDGSLPVKLSTLPTAGTPSAGSNITKGSAHFTNSGQSTGGNTYVSGGYRYSDTASSGRPVSHLYTEWTSVADTGKDITLPAPNTKYYVVSYITVTLDMYFAEPIPDYTVESTTVSEFITLPDIASASVSPGQSVDKALISAVFDGGPEPLSVKIYLSASAIDPNAPSGTVHTLMPGQFTAAGFTDHGISGLTYGQNYWLLVVIENATGQDTYALQYDVFDNWVPVTVNTFPSGTGSVTWYYVSSSGATVLSASSGYAPKSAAVTFTAGTAAGYAFSYWSGSVLGNAPSVSAAAGSSLNATANYASDPDAVTITVVKHGHASVLVNINGSGQFEYVSALTVSRTDIVELNAIDGPDAFHHWTINSVVSWNASVTGITYSTDVTAHAFFMDVNGSGSGENYYDVSLSVNPAGAGTITWSYEDASGTAVSQTGPGTVRSGAEVTFSQSENTGYTFSYWSGSVLGNVPAVSITASPSLNATANYASDPDAVTMTVVKHGHASVLVNINGLGQFGYVSAFTVSRTDTVELNAVDGPDVFHHWSVNSVISWDATLTGSTYPTDVTAHAFFMDVNGSGSGEYYYDISASAAPVGAGTVTWSYVDVSGAAVSRTGSGKAQAGSLVTFSQSANTGYTFSYWSGDFSGISSSVTAPVLTSAGLNATANYVSSSDSVTVTVSVIGNGSVSVSVNGNAPFIYAAAFTVASTDIVEFEALDGLDAFHHWTINSVVSWDALVTGITYPADVTAYAFFMDVNGSGSGEDYYAVNAAASPAGSGTITWTYTDASGTTVSQTAPGYAPAGSVITFSQVPNTGYAFAYWSGDVSGTSSAASSALTSAGLNAAANYVTAAGFITVTVSVIGNGSVSVTINGNTPFVYAAAFTVASTDSVEFEALDGLDVFHHWTINSVVSWDAMVTGSAYPAGVTAYVFFMDMNGSGSGEDYCAVNVSVFPAGSGMVTWEYTDASGTTVSQTVSGYAPMGAIMILSQSANSGYTFSYWSEDISGTASSVTASALTSSGLNATANYVTTADSVTVTVSVIGNGSVSVTINGSTPFIYAAAFTVASTDSVEFTALDGADTFDHWTIGMTVYTSVSISQTFSLSETVSVFFADIDGTTSGPDHHAVNVSVSPAGSGTITWSYLDSLGATVSRTGSGYAPAGAEITFLQSSNAGYVFSYWSGSVLGNASSVVAAADSSLTVTANYAADADAVTITVTIHGDGTVLVNINGSGQFGYASVLTVSRTDTVEFEALAGADAFDRWSVGSDTVTTSTLPGAVYAESVTIEVFFAEPAVSGSFTAAVLAALILFTIFLALLLFVGVNYNVCGTVLLNEKGVKGAVIEYYVSGEKMTSVSDRNGGYRIKAKAGSEVTVTAVTAEGCEYRGELPMSFFLEKTTQTDFRMHAK